MNSNEANLGRALLRALLQHPETVVVLDGPDRIRIAYRDELDHSRG